MVENKTVLTIVGGIGFLILLVIITLFIVSIFTDVYDGFNFETSSSSETLLTNGGVTLLQTPNSISATRLNQTWLDFDGDYWLIPDNEILTGNYTYSIWIKPNNDSSTGAIISSNINTRGTFLYNPGTNLTYTSMGNPNTVLISGKNSVLNGIWTHVSLVVKQHNATYGNQTIFINGDLKGSSLFNGSTTDGSKLTIGAFNNELANFFNGSMDSPLIYDSALSSSEVDKIYLRGRKDSPYDINKTKLSNTTYNTAYVYYNGTDSLIYTTKAQDLYKSINYGSSFSKLCDNCVGNILYIDNITGNIFSGLYNGNLSVFIGNDTNWTQQDIFSCADNHNSKNSSFQDQGMTTDDLGNIYLGEYGGVDANSNCSFIYKSNDEGNTWSIVYNASEKGWSATHIHLVQFDPYTKNIYATQGDPRSGDPSPSRLFKSEDYGTTWVSLGNGSSRWQYLHTQFTEGYRFFGTDIANLDNYIDVTTDDISFDLSLNISGSLAKLITSSGKSSDGFVMFGSNGKLNNSASIWATNNNGDDWYIIDLIKNLTTDNQGFPSMSFISDDLGFNYLIDDGSEVGGKMYRFNIVDEYGFLHYKLNSNQGTIAYDVSGNGNNGTITGASWNNDGITVALTNLIDYTLVGSTFNLLTNLWDQVVVSYVYGDSHTVEAMNSNFTAGIDNVSEKIPTILLISAVILLFGVLIILIAKSKEMGIGDGASL